MDNNEKSDKVKKNVFRESEEVNGIAIKGYDFNNGVDYERIIKSFSSTGFQATHLNKAIEIVNKMIQESLMLP